jgi:hypothetical protein
VLKEFKVFKVNKEFRETLVLRELKGFKVSREM